MNKIFLSPLKNQLNTQTSISQRCYRGLVSLCLASASLISQSWVTNPLQAQTTAYCKLSSEAVAAKANLLVSSLKGSGDAQKQYKALLTKHAETLRQCRAKTWPKDQAIWLRLYPCDAQSGSIDAVLDRIVNAGYNQVYLEVFFDSQVLLPAADNPTPWLPVIRTKGYEKTDLLAQTIAKGKERGLKVYAWLFTMNFGYTYSQRADRQDVLALNGQGQNSTNFVADGSQAFIDPYNRQAQVDYYRLLETVLKRRPDGVLFDYVRYPRGTGPQSVVSQVKDLWIYGSASQRALYNRATNQKGRALIERYVTQGKINASDVANVDKLYPDEDAPLWQGRNATATETQEPMEVRLAKLQLDLWYLVVAHAAQGVLDFVSFVSQTVERKGIPAGTVFFPDGNQVVGKIGFDSRLQAWDKFSASLQWHPMSYGVCGTPDCIVDQVRRVTSMAPQGTKIQPALAGQWGKTYDNRPPLEEQMQAIRNASPEVNAISHFAYSWQEPELDKERRFCNLK